jgi:hypothetical protein
MNLTRFDRLTMTVGRRTPRRTAFGVLAALGLTGLAREEAGAICASPGEACQSNDGCCSGVCGMNQERCRCPQRICCQCSPFAPVPCAYVSNHAACAERCLKRTGSASSTVFNPRPGMQTTRCEGTLCRPVDCVPT